MKRLLLFIFVFLAMVGSAFSVTDEDLRNGSQLYYTLDDDFISGSTIIDSVGNYNGTNNGATCGVAGKINQSCSFDAPTEYIDTTNVFSGNTEFTVSLWVNFSNLATGTSTLSRDYILASIGTAGNRPLTIWVDNSGDIVLYVNDAIFKRVTGTGLTINQFYMVSVTYDGSLIKTYVNGVEKSSDAFSSTLQTSSTLDIGSNTDAGSSQTNNVIIDEVAIWNEAKTASEVQELYNRQANATTGSQYDFTSSALNFDTITLNNDTLTDPFFSNSQELNFSTFVTSSNNNTNINQTYFLYNSTGLQATTQFATNNQNGFFTLNLNEGQYNISFYAQNDETNVTTQNYTFLVDTTPPTINNTLPLEINSYNLGNLSDYISCNHIGINGICQVQFQPDNVSYNVTDNVTFTFNGNQSYTITAEDEAGNTATETGTIFVNPFVYFYFKNSVTNNNISDYTVDGFQVNGTEYKRKYFDIFTSLNQTFQFVKNGYETTNFNVDMLNNQTINETFNITPVNLFIRVFDGDTLNPINFNLTLENSNITSYQNLAVFNQSFPNIPLGDIKVIISAQNYSQAVYYTSIQVNSSLSFVVYLTPESLTSVITFNVRDFSTNNLLGDVLIEARRIINDSKVTVQQTETDANGLAYLFLDNLKDYQFVFSRSGYVSSTISSIPSVTTYTVKLTSDSTTYSYIDDVSYRFTPEGGAIYGGNNVTFKAFISSNSLTQSRLVIVDNFGNTLTNQTSTNPLGTEFEYSQFFLNNTNISKVTMTMSYIINGIEKEVSKEYSVFSIADSGVEDFINFADENSEEDRLLRFFIIITTFATFIILGNRNQTTREFVSLITLIPLFIFTFVGWIPFLYATVLTFILIVLFMGGNKR